MNKRAIAILVTVAFFLLMVAPTVVAIVKEKFFTPKDVHVIATDTSGVKK